MSFSSSSKRLLTAGVVMALMAGTAAAQTLTIGLSAEPTSADPHYHNLGPNNSLSRQIYAPLINQDAQQQLLPGLATEWEAVDDTTWRLQLREGATFSNGEAFTARDVIYTVCRIPLVKDSPSSFTLYSGAITGMEAEDDHTLILKTDTPAPLLPVMLSTFGIISATASGAEDEVVFGNEECQGVGEAPASSAFSRPDFAIGAGPFKLTQFTPGEQIVLERNDNFWGDAPDWETVVLRPISNQGARVAALLAGDVDMIENPPTQDLDRIEGEGFQVSSGLSNRVVYIALDQGEAPTPTITGIDKDDNPLLDVRVREALSIAIDREAIKERLMRGLSQPAGQLLPWPMFGTEEDRGPVEFNAERAAELLTEAGYPDGFSITLGSPNDRYINDAQISQAVAQMWARIGVKTEVDAKTASAFFDDRNKFKYSAFLAGWGAATGEMSSPLGALVATRDASRSLGGTNYTRHSNPEMDDLLVEALETVDDDKREALLQQASAMVMDSHGIIPIHFELTTWALRQGIEYEARADQYTLSQSVFSTE